MRKRDERRRRIEQAFARLRASVATALGAAEQEHAHRKQDVSRQECALRIAQHGVAAAYRDPGAISTERGAAFDAALQDALDERAEIYRAWQTAPQWHKLCRWGLETGADGRTQPFTNTDSGSVLKYGVELGTRTWRAFLERLGWAREQVDRIICHQVGLGHQESILRALGIPPEKDFPTYRWLGNMGTVSLPLTAALAEERGHLRPGHRVGFLGIGSGLNCLMIGVRW